MKPGKPCDKCYFRVECLIYPLNQCYLELGSISRVEIVRRMAILIYEEWVEREPNEPLPLMRVVGYIRRFFDNFRSFPSLYFLDFAIAHRFVVACLPKLFIFTKVKGVTYISKIA